MLTNTWRHGVTTGTVPGFDTNYVVRRTATEIGSNGFFRVDYVIVAPYPLPVPNPRFSLLFFRPELSVPGSPSEAPNAPRSPLMKPATTTPNLAIRAVQHCLLGAHSFTAHLSEYAFAGTLTNVQFVTHLPPWFPGMKGEDAGIPRRVRIFGEPISKKRYNVMLEHVPAIPPGLQTAPQKVFLSKNVPAFLYVYSANRGPELTRTNGWHLGIPTSVYQELWAPKWIEYDHDWDDYYGNWDHYDDDWYYRADVMGFSRFAIPVTPIIKAWQIPGSIPTIDTLPSSEARLPRLAAKTPVASAAATTPKPAKLRPMRTADVELEWLGRSGVEMARYALSQQHEDFDALNQPWAGATWDTNNVVTTLPLHKFPLDGGKITVDIVDLDRKANINVVPPEIIAQALALNNVDAATTTTILDSITDWMDADDVPGANGAENEYYLGLNPPYQARNGVMTEISELAYVKGVTPELVYGSSDSESPTVPAPLRDLFTTVSGGLININTASNAALQLIPAFDATLAQAIVAHRAGADGVDGTADDMPFRTVAELSTVPGITPEILQAALPYVGTSSTTFEVTVATKIGSSKRTYVAWLRRITPQEIVILKMREK